MIIVGILLLGSLWFIIRNIKRRMFYDVKNQSAASLSESYLEEKSQCATADITWPVTIETSGGNISAKTKDLNLGGAFIICQNPFPLKERFRLTIDAPGQEQMTLTSEVIWSNNNVPDDKIVNRGMGIRFLQNVDEDRESLKTAISVAA